MLSLKLQTRQGCSFLLLLPNIMVQVSASAAWKKRGKKCKRWKGKTSCSYHFLAHDYPYKKWKDLSLYIYSHIHTYMIYMYMYIYNVHVCICVYI